MAKLQNIPIPLVGTIKTINDKNSNKAQNEQAPDIFAESLTQWRILIYATHFSVFLSMLLKYI